jgi:hypothetical protein
MGNGGDTEKEQKISAIERKGAIENFSERQRTQTEFCHRNLPSG